MVFGNITKASDFNPLNDILKCENPTWEMYDKHWFMTTIKKFIITLSILVVVTVFFGSHIYAQAERDLCGGTGGNGEIVSVGSNTFSLNLNDDGKKGGGKLIVNLADRATIETPTGNISASDLKIGDRVTLVGDNHRDGTFTAEAVVVCSAAQVAPTTARNKNPERYEKVSGILNTVIILLAGLFWVGIVTFLWLKRKKRLIYIVFFTIFYIYLYKVFDYTLLEFQSLIFLQYFVPNLMLNGYKDGTNVNLIPLATLKLEDLNTSFLNILMMIPFGFGLPFITNFRMKKVVAIGLLLSIIIELLQLITGFMANTTFRVADINDLIFNTTGVAIGYIVFIPFIRSYRHIFRNWKASNSFLRYIGERPQIDE